MTDRRRLAQGKRHIGVRGATMDPAESRSLNIVILHHGTDERIDPVSFTRLVVASQSQRRALLQIHLLRDE